MKSETQLPTVAALALKRNSDDVPADIWFSGITVLSTFDTDTRQMMLIVPATDGTRQLVHFPNSNSLWHDSPFHPGCGAYATAPQL